jgi:hypothetical protein
MILTMRLQNVSHDCIEKYQKIDDPISLRSNRADVAWRETSKKRPLSNKGTPRAWVLKGALRGRPDMIYMMFTVSFMEVKVKDREGFCYKIFEL